MPKSPASLATKTALTTTMRIELPAYDSLAEHYQLVRYELPDGLKFGNSDLNFARVHNAMKDGLDAPYRLFTHDQGGHWAVYALYPKTTPEPDTYTVLFEDSVLIGQCVPYTALRSHVLIKLLQVAYFRAVAHHPERFVSQDKCFIQVMKDKKRLDHYLCLEMELTQTPVEADNLFNVDEHAHYFRRVDKDDAISNMHHRFYYAQVTAPDNRLLAFRQLKRSEIQTAGGSLFTMRSYSGSRPTLDYHAINADEMTHTRGYHLYQFMDGFTEFLVRLGFAVTPQQRIFHEYVNDSASTFALPIGQLQTVYVLDIRLAKAKIPFAPFVALYHELFPDVTFQLIESLDDLTQTPNPVVLIFQDAEKAAFEEGGPLYEGDYVDLYETLYRSYPHIPKQFVSVNGNVLEMWTEADGVTNKKKKRKLTDTEYLDYVLPTADKHARKNAETRAKVVMNELFLKDLILNTRTVGERLPAFPSEWMFVHAENRETKDETEPKKTYKVAMYVQDERLVFLDWGHADKSQFWTMLEAWGVEDAFEQIRRKERYNDAKEPSERPLLDVIVGPGLCIRIDTLPESIMYDYELLSKNSKLNAQCHTIQSLKLLPYFDQLRPEDSPPRADIETFFRASTAVSQPDKKTSQQALELYDNFVVYDALLDKYAAEHEDGVTLTLTELKEETESGDALGDKMRALFEPRQLTNYYKSIGLFGSMRPNQLIATYQGIWYTDEDQYVVGAVKGMQETQAHAQLVRQVVQTAGTLGIEKLLALTAVKFVRLEQYTIVPYPFHVIDLYIDNALRYELRNGI